MEIQAATGEWMNEYARRPNRRRDSKSNIPVSEVIKKSIRRSWTIANPSPRWSAGRNSSEQRTYYSLPRNSEDPFGDDIWSPQSPKFTKFPSTSEDLNQSPLMMTRFRRQQYASQRPDAAGKSEDSNARGTTSLEQMPLSDSKPIPRQQRAAEQGSRLPVRQHRRAMTDLGPRISLDQSDRINIKHQRRAVTDLGPNVFIDQTDKAPFRQKKFVESGRFNSLDQTDKATCRPRYGSDLLPQNEILDKTKQRRTFSDSDSALKQDSVPVLSETSQGQMLPHSSHDSGESKIPCMKQSTINKRQDYDRATPQCSDSSKVITQKSTVDPKPRECSTPTQDYSDSGGEVASTPPKRSAVLRRYGYESLTMRSHDCEYSGNSDSGGEIVATPPTASRRFSARSDTETSSPRPDGSPASIRASSGEDFDIESISGAVFRKVTMKKRRQEPRKMLDGGDDYRLVFLSSDSSSKEEEEEEEEDGSSCDWDYFEPRREAAPCCCVPVPVPIPVPVPVPVPVPLLMHADTDILCQGQQDGVRIRIRSFQRPHLFYPWPAGDQAAWFRPAGELGSDQQPPPFFPWYHPYLTSVEQPEQQASASAKQNPFFPWFNPFQTPGDPKAVQSTTQDNSKVDPDSEKSKTNETATEDKKVSDPTESVNSSNSVEGPGDDSVASGATAETKNESSPTENDAKDVIVGQNGSNAACENAVSDQTADERSSEASVENTEREKGGDGLQVVAEAQPQEPGEERAGASGAERALASCDAAARPGGGCAGAGALLTAGDGAPRVHGEPASLVVDDTPDMEVVQTSDSAVSAGEADGLMSASDSDSDSEPDHGSYAVASRSSSDDEGTGFSRVFVVNAGLSDASDEECDGIVLLKHVRESDDGDLVSVEPANSDDSEGSVPVKCKRSCSKRKENYFDVCFDDSSENSDSDSDGGIVLLSHVCDKNADKDDEIEEENEFMKNLECKGTSSDEDDSCNAEGDGVVLLRHVRDLNDAEVNGSPVLPEQGGQEAACLPSSGERANYADGKQSTQLDLSVAPEHEGDKSDKHYENISLESLFSSSEKKEDEMENTLTACEEFIKNERIYYVTEATNQALLPEKVSVLADVNYSTLQDKVDLSSLEELTSAEQFEINSISSSSFQDSGYQDCQSGTAVSADLVTSQESTESEFETQQSVTFCDDSDSEIENIQSDCVVLQDCHIETECVYDVNMHNDLILMSVETEDNSKTTNTNLMSTSGDSEVDHNAELLSNKFETVNLVSEESISQHEKKLPDSTSTKELSDETSYEIVTSAKMQECEHVKPTGDFEDKSDHVVSVETTEHMLEGSVDIVINPESEETKVETQIPAKPTKRRRKRGKGINKEKNTAEKQAESIVAETITAAVTSNAVEAEVSEKTDVESSAVVQTADEECVEAETKPPEEQADAVKLIETSLKELLLQAAGESAQAPPVSRSRSPGPDLRYTSLVMITQEPVSVSTPAAVTVRHTNSAGPAGFFTLALSAAGDQEEVRVVTGADTLSAVLQLEDGLADDDSWVEDCDDRRDEDEFATTTPTEDESSGDETSISYMDREEELRGYHRSAIDFTLHTIVEESCEESEVETGGKKSRPTSASELEKYFFFRLGGGMNNPEPDSMSDTASSIYSEGLDSFGGEDMPDDGGDDAAELASSRLEKYFFTTIKGFESDTSVGSDSEGCPSPEQRRKRLVRPRGAGRLHTSSQECLDQPSNEPFEHTGESEGSSSTETDAPEDTSFDKNDGQFDTVKRKKKKQRGSSATPRTATPVEEGDMTSEAEEDRTSTPQPEPISDRNKQQSRDSGFIGSCDDLLREQRNSSDSSASSDPPTSSKKEADVILESIDSEQDKNKTEDEAPLLTQLPSSSTPLTRKDSFNNWSSDEETNLMMSKMRAFFKTMVASNKTPQASPSTRPRKPPQLVYFESELTRLMKTVPGIRDDQVREIVEYLSSEDTWSDSCDSSDYTSSDLEGAAQLQQQISASCQQIIRKFDGGVDDEEEDDEAYQRLMASFNQMSVAGTTPHSSPPLIAKVMHHIGSRLVALMHEVSSVDGVTTSSPKARYHHYHRRLQQKPSTASTTTEEDEDSHTDTETPTAQEEANSSRLLPRSRSHDLLLEGRHPQPSLRSSSSGVSDIAEEREASDNERFSWRGSFESALMAADSRTRLSLLASGEKRRSAGDLLLAASRSREQLDRVRSCGSIGGGVGEEKLWGRRRSSVPDANTGGSGASADGDDDDDDEDADDEREGGGKSTTLPRSLQATTVGTTNSLPRLPGVYKAHSAHHVKSARYRPPGFLRPTPPKRAVSAPGLQQRRDARRRLQPSNPTAGDDGSIHEESSPQLPALNPSPLVGGAIRKPTGSVSSGEWPAEEDIDRLVMIHQQKLGPRTESLASVYSGAGEGRYGTVAVKGEVEFGLQYNYKAGDLEIHVKQCRDLAPVDIKRNRSDPYVKVYLLPDKSKSGKRKTKVKKHTLNPVFDEVLKFHITLHGLETRTLWLTVWHSDMFGRNDFLGEVMMTLENKVFDDPTPQWYPLQERTEPFDDLLSYKGDIIIGLKFVPPDVTVPKKGKRSRGSLHVLVKEAKNLTAVKANGTSDPFCKSYLLPDKGRSSKQKTPVLRRTCNPAWNYTFVYEDVSLQELSERSLELTVWDHDRLASNEFLGGLRFNLGSGKHYGKAVDWMDATGKELTLWQSMLERPNLWVEGGLTLRPSLEHRSSGS